MLDKLDLLRKVALNTETNDEGEEEIFFSCSPLSAHCSFPWSFSKRIVTFLLSVAPLSLHVRQRCRRVNKDRASATAGAPMRKTKLLEEGTDGTSRP
ncbi:MAG: hypothetical protein MZU95_03935 [Desulfomicrobium escambiense]|nr:hypothetical protein [Desulfomicrobium escambiense]